MKLLVRVSELNEATFTNPDNLLASSPHHLLLVTLLTLNLILQGLDRQFECWLQPDRAHESADSLKGEHFSWDRCKIAIRDVRHPW